MPHSPENVDFRVLTWQDVHVNTRCHRAVNRLQHHSRVVPPALGPGPVLSWGTSPRAHMASLPSCPIRYHLVREASVSPNLELPTALFPALLPPYHSHLPTFVIHSLILLSVIFPTRMYASYGRGLHLVHPSVPRAENVLPNELSLRLI